MADIETAAWSETAASNIQPSPDGWPSNSSPTIVYSTDREMMGAIKRDWDRRNPTVTSGGSANSQTLTYTSLPTAMVRGQCYSFIAGFANTGPMTLQIGALAATAVQANGAALVGGEMKVGLISKVMYDGTNFQLIAGSGAGAGAYLPLAGGQLSGGLTFSPSTNGIKGTTTNDSAAAGFVGEYISSVVTSPGVTLTSNTQTNITTISLTAGDWDVSGEVWIAVGTGGATVVYGGVTNSSANLPGNPVVGQSRTMIAAALTAGQSAILSVAPSRVSLASTTTYYLVAFAFFPSGTTTAYGRIGARRVR